MDATNTVTPARAVGDRYYGPVHPAPTSLGGMLARADARHTAEAEQAAARRAADEALAASLSASVPATVESEPASAGESADTVVDLRTSPPVVHHPDPPMVAALHDLVAQAAVETWWSLEIAADDTRRRGGDTDPLASLGWSLREDE